VDSIRDENNVRHGRTTVVITGVNTISLYVSDQQQARDFYVDKLGFEVRTDASMGPAGRWLEVAPKGARTGLVLADAAGYGKQDRIGDSADLIFSTDDVNGLHERLVALGVPVTAPETQPWGTFVKVTDPDGHTFLVSGRS
jgi:catechol 2,3-dioxygenase-like lactoylglutathione lyase family enzyme